MSLRLKASPGPSLLYSAPRRALAATDCPWTETRRNKKVLFTAQAEACPLLSFLERGEFGEGVPEQRRLPLGFCQGEHLLLRDAGGHRDVALVHGVQALVWWGHGASIIA